DELALDASGIASRALEASGGDAGQVAIRARTLTLENASLISSATNASGDAGDVSIEVGTLRLSGSAIESGAAAEASGDGGTVAIIADTLALQAQSSITTSTLSSGNAGK